jgi:hypothetical protein
LKRTDRPTCWPERDVIAQFVIQMSSFDLYL